MGERHIVIYDIEDLSMLSGMMDLGDSEEVIHDYEFDHFANEPNHGLTFFRLLFFIVGILGNLMVIFVILILAEYKKAVTHWYVLQLAIADSIFLVTLPFRVAEEIQKDFQYTNFTCKLKETILFLNYYSSICFLVVMSVDRYIAVCHWRTSSFLQKLRTPFAAGIITACVWIACLLMCIPIMLYSVSKGVKPNCICQYDFPKYQDPSEACRLEGEKPGTPEFDMCVDHIKSITSKDEGFCRDKDSFKEENQNTSFAEGVGAILEMSHEDLFGEVTPSPFSGDSENQGEILEMSCSYFGYAQGFIAFLYFNFIVMFLIPLIIMAACYICIVIRLNATRVRGESYGGGQSSSNGSRPNSVSSTGRSRIRSSSSKNKSNRNRTRVTIMCASMVILFVICWLPFHSVHLAKMRGISGTREYCELLSSAVSLIAFANSMLNPFIYNFIGTRFVRRLRSVRESRTAKAFFHLASGVTGAATRNSSTSGTEQNHDKSSTQQQRRWRSEAPAGDNHLASAYTSTVHYKAANDKVEESCAELLKKYPIYTGPSAQPPQLSENQSRNEPPRYQELPSNTISESDLLTTQQATVIQEQ